MDRPVHVLIIEDLQVDVTPIEHQIRLTIPTCVFVQVATRAAYLAQLTRFQPDVIVTEYQLSRFDGNAVIQLARFHAPSTPVIVLTSAHNEAGAIACMQAGAIDYVLKEHRARLGFAVRHALRARQHQDAQQHTDDALQAVRSVYDHAPIGLFRTTPDGRVLMANPAAVRLLGYLSFDAFAAHPLQDHSAEPAASQQADRAQLEREGAWTGLERMWKRADQRVLWVRISAHVIYDAAGASRYYDGCFEDITAQRQVQEALHLTQFWVDHAGIGIIRTGPDAHILQVNDAMCHLVGYTADELTTMRIIDLDPSFSMERWRRHRQDLRARGVGTFETTHRRKDGTLVPVEITHTYLEFHGNGFAVSFVRDLSARKQTEATQARLEHQLLQAQKMESIGRLASGVAHDFNNLLTVIQGYCDLIEAALPPGAPLLDELGQIRRASQRAATLTRQLLTFSRKPISSPATIALNEVIEHLRPSLTYLIGAPITLVTTLAPDLYPVRADPEQIEQVLMNVVLNARDAMPTGGTLRIETRNVDPDLTTTLHPADAPRGPAVLLQVMDTGSGMDAYTQQHLFEPFFTTKAVGKGTGLGLATVYGIITQKGGTITVDSQLGQGTTFRIVLAAGVSVASQPADPHVLVGAPAAHETVLVVEDDALVRTLLRTVLQHEGYTMLEAADGPSALAVAQQHPNVIDMLVATVALPGKRGRELAEQLRQRHPHMRVLWLSDDPDDPVLQQDALRAHGTVLAKPFSPLKLVANIRDVLDRTRVADRHTTPPYYHTAQGALTHTLDISHGATMTRSFAQVLVAQGSVLAVVGDLGAARDHFRRGQAIYQALGDQRSAVALLERLGWVAREQGDAAIAHALLTEGLALSRVLGDSQLSTWMLLTMAGVAILQEDASMAERLIADGRVLHPESHDWMGWSLNHLGHAAHLREDYDWAAQLHQQTLTLFIERLGDHSIGVLWAYHGLAETALAQADAAAARRWLLPNLQRCRELGTRIMASWCLAGLGSAAALDGAFAQAVAWWSVAEQARRALGCRPAPVARTVYERLQSQARVQLGDQAFAAAWTHGASRTLEQAIAAALDTGKP